MNFLKEALNKISEEKIPRRAMVMKVQGRRKRGRPKRRWLDKVKDDIKEKGLSADDVYDRATWRRMSSYIDPTQKWDKMKKKSEEKIPDIYDEKTA